MGENIKLYKEENPDTSILIITHHPKILEYLNPDYVHIIEHGIITNSGSYSLALDIEKNGYNNYKNGKNDITNGVTHE